MLIEARKPMLVPGLEVTKAHGEKEMLELAELLAIPVTQGLSAFADFPNQHPLSLGWYTKYLGYNKDCDLFVVIGTQIPDEGHYVYADPLRRPPKSFKFPTSSISLASGMKRTLRSFPTRDRLCAILSARSRASPPESSSIGCGPSATIRRPTILPSSGRKPGNACNRAGTRHRLPMPVCRRNSTMLSILTQSSRP